MNEVGTNLSRWTGRHCGRRIEELERPDFETAGKIHDWRNHVGDGVRSIWDSLTLEQRAAVAVDAYEMAANEEWD